MWCGDMKPLQGSTDPRACEIRAAASSAARWSPITFHATQEARPHRASVSRKSNAVSGFAWRAFWKILEGIDLWLTCLVT